MTLAQGLSETPESWSGSQAGGKGCSGSGRRARRPQMPGGVSGAVASDPGPQVSLQWPIATLLRVEREKRPRPQRQVCIAEVSLSVLPPPDRGSPSFPVSEHSGVALYHAM